MVGIRSASAIAMAVLIMATASVILFTEDSDATEGHGTSDHPLTAFDFDGYTLIDDSDRTYYVAVGSEVNVHAGYHKANSWSAISYYSPVGVTSGYGLSYNGSVVSGTISKEGLIEVRIVETNMGNTVGDYTIRIFSVNTLKTCIVTYDAGIGLVNGENTWSEEVIEGSFASMPQAAHSSGAYTFLGWAVSATDSEPLSSYNVFDDVTLHAVWKRNAVLVTDATATVTQGQTASLPLSTSPSGAVLSISSYGGLSTSNLRVIDHDLILDMTDVEPGTYYVTVSASYSGYISGESTVTIRVPITIVKPIEYVLSEDDFFSYTPVTNPTNAAITLISVTKDGNSLEDLAGLSVNGRTISGSFVEKGTYAITYRASMQGYVDVTNTVFVKVNERQASAPAPIMGNITATPRATEPRVYDLVISGYSNASNVIWSIDGKVFATSSPTALYEFPASGVFTIKCTLAGFDGSFVSDDVVIVCTDNYHRDAAWAGIDYRYVIDSDSVVSIEGGSPFSIINSEVEGSSYRMISGNPSEAYIGQSFDVHVGDDSWTITVYPAEQQAPVADFDLILSDDGYTVVAIFNGQNASFYSYDFDGDGISDNGNAFTYSNEGRYTVVCKAVNNISEVTCSKSVEINVVQHEEIDILGLTDFEMVVGERLDVCLDLGSLDRIAVSGPASDFTDIMNNVLRFRPTVKGIFELVVTVLHDDGTNTTKSINVIVRGTENVQIKELEEKNHDYMMVMAIFFIVSIIAIAAFILRDINPKAVSGSSFKQRIERRRLDKLYRRGRI